MPTLFENCLASPTNRRRNHFPWRRRSACAEPVLQPFGENRKSFKLNIRRDERKTPSCIIHPDEAMRLRRGQRAFSQTSAAPVIASAATCTTSPVASSDAMVEVLKARSER